MPDDGDLFPLLGLLLDAALRAGRDGTVYAERIADRIGLEAYAGPEAAEKALREALGLAANGACELVWTRDGTVCGHPAVDRLTGACLHGHVTEREVCEDHKAPEEPLWCRACYRLPAPDDHKCPVALFPAGIADEAVSGI